MAKRIKIKTEEPKISRGEIIAKVVFPYRKEYSSGIAINDPADAKGVEEPVFYTSDDLEKEIMFPKIIDDDKNFYTLIAATRNGLPYKSLHTAEVIMPFSSQEWAKMLHVSKRSIDRLKKEKKKLSTTQSEKLIEVTLLYDYGVDVFGSSEKFTKWLDRSNLALGGVAPKSLLDTNQGIKAVKTELSRIEYGVLA